MNRMIGKQSVSFTDPPYILGEASVCGPKEADGPLAGYFDIVSEDPTYFVEIFGIKTTIQSFLYPIANGSDPRSVC